MQGLQQGSVTQSLELHSVDQLQETIPEIMSRLATNRYIPQLRQMQLLTRLRLAKNFPSPTQRRKCVMARLQAISILGKCGKCDFQIELSVGLSSCSVFSGATGDSGAFDI